MSRGDLASALLDSVELFGALQRLQVWWKAALGAVESSAWGSGKLHMGPEGSCAWSKVAGHSCVFGRALDQRVLGRDLVRRGHGRAYSWQALRRAFVLSSAHLTSLCSHVLPLMVFYRLCGRLVGTVFHASLSHAHVHARGCR